MTNTVEHGGVRGGDRRVTAAWIGVALLILLAPLVAMRFTEEVDWTAGDFVFAIVMLFGAGGAYEVLARMAGFAYRAGAALAILTAFVLIWVNGAVGIVGDGDNPATLLFAGVLAIGVIGAVIAQFRPLGMAVTLFAMAGAQLLSAGIVLGMGWGEPRDAGLTAFFCLLWLLAGGLFRKAAESRLPADLVI